MTAMTIRKSMVGFVCLASLKLDSYIDHGGNVVAAFVMTPMGPLIGKGRIREGRLKWPITVAEKGNQVFEVVSEPEPEDTVRVRIWRALASSFGEEMTLKQLGAIVGERRTGELRTHLQHVEKQAKTLKNKNAQWRERRGLSISDAKRVDKLRIRIRRGKKNEVYIKLD